MSNWWPPKQAKPEENYKKLTMFDCLDLCVAYIKNKEQSNKKDKYDLKGIEKYRKYTPTIEVARNSLQAVERDIEEAKTNVIAMEKMVAKMKLKKAPMPQLAEMMSALLETKKEHCLLLKEDRRLKVNLEKVYTQIGIDLTLKQKTHNETVLSEDEMDLAGRTLEKYRRTVQRKNHY